MLSLIIDQKIYLCNVIRLEVYCLEAKNSIAEIYLFINPPSINLYIKPLYPLDHVIIDLFTKFSCTCHSYFNIQSVFCFINCANFLQANHVKKYIQIYIYLLLFHTIQTLDCLFYNMASAMAPQHILASAMAPYPGQPNLTFPE